MASSVRITDKDHGWAAMRKRVFGFGKPKITVGVLAGEGDEPKASGALTVLEAAIINEFGSENGDIPARPAIRGWFDSAQKEIHDRLFLETQAVIAGKRTKEQALQRVALWAVGEIQKRIADGVEPANADSTVRRKGSSTPLVNTGQFRSSIASRVEP